MEERRSTISLCSLEGLQKIFLLFSQLELNDLNKALGKVGKKFFSRFSLLFGNIVNSGI